MLGFGNNSISLLAGVMVLCTFFAILPADVAQSTLEASGNEGLTFIWVPQLFGQMPGGSAFMIFFFLALVFAAWSSIIAMIELATRILMDAGLARKRAILVVGAAGFLLGLPSALSPAVFANQDWVWGVGLMLSGFFFAFCVVRYGVDRFRTTFVNREGTDITIGRWWNWAMWLVLVEAVVLMVWWLAQAAQTDDLAATLTPFSSFNVGTVLIQWAVVLVALIGLNRFLASQDGRRRGGERVRRTILLALSIAACGTRPEPVVESAPEAPAPEAAAAADPLPEPGGPGVAEVRLVVEPPRSSRR